MSKSAAPGLAVTELALDDEVELKRVNLVEGENFDPAFVKINPKASLPTLTADGTAYVDTTEVVDYLVKKSSVKVAPRTAITKEVHADSIDPNFAFIAARDDAELARVSSGFAGIFTTHRLAGLKMFAATAEGAPYKDLYDSKISIASNLAAIYAGQASADVKAGFFAISKGLWDAIKVFYLEMLPASIAGGPFIAGAVPGEDDFHVAAWLAHIAMLVGAAKTEDGLAALEKGFQAPVPPKVAAYWNAWSVRKSWGNVYPDGALH